MSNSTFFPAEILTRVLMNLAGKDLETSSFANKTWRACAKQAQIENRRHDVTARMHKSSPVNFRPHDIIRGALGPVKVYRAHRKVVVHDPVPKHVTLNNVRYPVICIYERYIFGAHCIVELTSDSRYGAYVYALYLSSSTTFVIPPFVDKLLLTQARRASNDNWKIEDESPIYAGLRIYYATQSLDLLTLCILNMNRRAIERLDQTVKHTKSKLLIWNLMGPSMAANAAKDLPKVMEILANPDPDIQEDLALLSYYGVSSYKFATTSSRILNATVKDLALVKLTMLSAAASCDRRP